MISPGRGMWDFICNRWEVAPFFVPTSAPSCQLWWENTKMDPQTFSFREKSRKHTSENKTLKICTHNLMKWYYRNTHSGISKIYMLTQVSSYLSTFIICSFYFCACSMPGPVSHYRELCKRYQKTPTNCPLFQEGSTSKKGNNQLCRKRSISWQKPTI